MSAKEKSEPGIQDYKKYVRQLKGRIQGLKDQNNTLIDDNSKTKNEFNKQIQAKCMDYALKVNKKVVKIQSAVRGKLARNSFQKNLTALKESKTQESRPNTNEFVLNRSLRAAQSMGMNLEMVFRAADKDHIGAVTVSEFKHFLQTIKFKLSRSQ